MRFVSTAAPVLALAATVLGGIKTISPPPIDFDPQTSQKSSQCWSDMVPDGTDWYIIATVPKRDMEKVCRDFMVDLMTRQHCRFIGSKDPICRVIKTGIEIEDMEDTNGDKWHEGGLITVKGKDEH
ncbi:hypothetical protein LY76DRAFT_604971 [Colletotrichum caudatum]|nr:hypothetical protein LY76DRAFT_604971 [Colletotrichum caudatum]